MDNFKIIFRILSYLEKSLDFEDVDLEAISAEHLGITENRWLFIMIMLIENNYVEGLNINKFLGGSISIKPNHPRITLKGLEYLEENSLMKKAYNMLKGIKDITPGL